MFTLLMLAIIMCLQDTLYVDARKGSPKKTSKVTVHIKKPAGTPSKTTIHIKKTPTTYVAPSRSIVISRKPSTVYHHTSTPMHGTGVILLIAFVTIVLCIFVVVC